MDKSLMLDPADYVGVTFWIISAAMVAATYFFYVERDRAVGKWKTSLTVAAMVTGIAAIHYFYMREVWVGTGESPIVFRYVDWLLTVPLQIVEFYLILAAVAAVAAGLFWRLLIASLVMLIAGYLGEVGGADGDICGFGSLLEWPAGFISFMKSSLVKLVRSTQVKEQMHQKQHLMRSNGSLP
jgi:hypothetical protein